MFPTNLIIKNFSNLTTDLILFVMYSQFTYIILMSTKRLFTKGGKGSLWELPTSSVFESWSIYTRFLLTEYIFGPFEQNILIINRKYLSLTQFWHMWSLFSYTKNGEVTPTRKSSATRPLHCICSLLPFDLFSGPHPHKFVLRHPYPELEISDTLHGFCVKRPNCMTRWKSL